MKQPWVYMCSPSRSPLPPPSPPDPSRSSQCTRSERFFTFNPAQIMSFWGKLLCSFQLYIPSTCYSQPFGYGSVSSLNKGMNELNQSRVPFDAFQVSGKRHSQLLEINIPGTTCIPKVFMHPLKKRSYFRRYLAKS